MPVSDKPFTPLGAAYTLPIPGLHDDNRISNGTDLIRLSIVEESCNPIAELGVRLGIWPVEGVRGGAGPGGAMWAPQLRSEGSSLVLGLPGPQ